MHPQLSSAQLYITKLSGVAQRRAVACGALPCAAVLMCRAALQRCQGTCQCQAVCLSRQISMSRHMIPIPGRKTPHYLYGNPKFMLFRRCVLCAAMSSSTAAAAATAADRTRHKQPAASSQQSVVGASNRPPWIPFWSWGNVLFRRPVMLCAVSLSQP